MGRKALEGARIFVEELGIPVTPQVYIYFFLEKGKISNIHN